MRIVDLVAEAIPNEVDLGVIAVLMVEAQIEEDPIEIVQIVEVTLVVELGVDRTDQQAHRMDLKNLPVAGLEEIEIQVPEVVVIAVQEVEASIAEGILIAADLRKKIADLVIEIAPIVELVAEIQTEEDSIEIVPIVDLIAEAAPVERDRIITKQLVADLGVVKKNQQEAGTDPKNLLVIGVVKKEIQVPVAVVTVVLEVEDLLAVAILIVVDLRKKSEDLIVEAIPDQVDLEKKQVRIPEVQAEVTVSQNLEVNANLRANRIVALVNPKPLRRKIISRKLRKDTKAADVPSARFNNNRNNPCWLAKI